jgi:hypothetical protein
MQELAWLAEVLRVWAEGGSWAEIQALPGFRSLLVLAAFLVPSTIIALGIGMTEWHETPLGRWFGAQPDPKEEGWSERARDLDKDGTPDF